MKTCRYIEQDKKYRTIELSIVFLTLFISVLFFVSGFSKLFKDYGNISYVDTLELYRDRSIEDYDEDCSICEVSYGNGEQMMVISYSYEEYLALDEDEIYAYGYMTEDGQLLYFAHQDPDRQEIVEAYRIKIFNEEMTVFNLANSLFMVAIAFLIMALFGKCFSTYEKIWFISVMILTMIFSILFPEESANGVNGVIIMFFYLLDTFLNVLCELLISKQSRYNFLVSVGVELVEIAICLILRYRFATMAVTLLFWLPIDIISFIGWSRNKDEKEEELTIVRRLKGYQEVLVVVAILLWTIGVGYFLSGLDIGSDFLHNDELETIIVYLDACASAVGISNGLFIFFRLREQWIAWYICALLEGIMNILSGQYVLLVLKLAYFTNTTYGYIRWSNYIRKREES